MDRLISENLILSLFDGKVEQEAPIFSKTMTKIIKGLPSAYKGMTNGEVIKAMFGDDKVSEFMGYARIMARVGNWFNDGVVAEFDKDWWNSPYDPQESEG